MDVPRHVCPTAQFYRKADLQQTGGGGGGPQPTLAQLFAAVRPILANSERSVLVEKSAFQGAALTVKIEAEEGENDWAPFLAVFLTASKILWRPVLNRRGPLHFGRKYS